ncbi:MAG TPA: ATP-binding protein [bacterium]|nr:ATP-binding protein [bacterium]
MADTRRMGALWRRTWPFIAVGAVSILVAGFFISRQIQKQYLRQAHERLEREAAVLAQTASMLFRLDNAPLWHQQAREWHRLLDVRVTVIDSSGHVISDSDWPEDSAALWSGQVSAAAPAESVGEDRWAIGYSPVWNAELLYATKLVMLDGRTVGAIRLAIPLSALEGLKSDVRRMLITILIITGLLLLAISVWVGNSIRRPLARLAQTAARYSRGDWDARVPVDPYRSSDEFSELAHDFNRMADEVELRFLQSRRERDQLQAVLANMSDGVLALDAQGRIRLVNDAFRRFFRPVLSDPIGHTHVEAFRDRGLNDLIERLLAGETEESEELEISAPRRRILVVRPALIEAASGEDVRGVLVARDVTARRQIDQMRRDFVANVSHELRTPLTSILGYASALRDTGLASPAADFLGTIERNAERMNRIVGDLLDLSRIEAPGYRPEMTRFSLTALVDEIQAFLAQALAGKSQTLVRDIPADADACLADRDAVGRILTNLIDNAIKYGPEGHPITVSARRCESDLVLTVFDVGMGVPEADRPRLFERFFRVDRGRSREMGGTGLGLSIVKHLAEAHGGEARYEPNIPHGSRFIVRLPQGDAV